MLGYLDDSESRKGESDNAAAAVFIAPPVIAKPIPSTRGAPPPSINDGFAMPAPRPPKGSVVPSLLASKNEESGEEEEDFLSS